MNFFVNELLKEESTEKIFRILWIDGDHQRLFVIDIHDDRAFPVEKLISNIEDEIVVGSIKKYRDNEITHGAGGVISEAHLARRDIHWQLICGIVNDEPGIYVSESRGRLVNQLLTNHSISKPTLYKLLRRYWQRGKSPNALLPDYYKSGGKGKEKSVGDKKRGRPRFYGDQGINIDESTRNIFRLSIERYFLTNKRNYLTDAYKLMIKKYYSEDIYYENGEEKIRIKDESQLPSFTQFKYWYQKEYSIQQTISARHGGRRFERNHRPILGSSTIEVKGPGSRFQIDATVADVYLVSSYNRTWIIGRPVIYLVVDVFSRMVVGVYIGLEGPSWAGAMMALANTASNKKEFCSAYGIQISESEWPCEHLPEILLADRGEFEGYNVERLISAFNLHVENAASYRADLKGIVEKKFNVIQMKTKPFLPGYIDKDFQERGARDYRLDANLTLLEFSKIIIYQILMHNNKLYLNGYVRDEDMIKDDLNSIPLELWQWGIVNRSGKLKHISESFVRLHLLPQGEAQVTHRGIKFQGMLYGSDRAIKEGWFTKARKNGNWKITVSHDVRNVSCIYIHDTLTGTFEISHLLDHQSRYMNKSLDEVKILFANERERKESYKTVQLQAEIDYMTNTERIVKEAVKTTNAQNPEALPKGQRIANINTHRANEKKVRRVDESFTKPIKEEISGEVIPFVNDEVGERFDRLSIKKLLKKNGDDDLNE